MAYYRRRRFSRFRGRRSYGRGFRRRGYGRHRRVRRLRIGFRR